MRAWIRGILQWFHPMDEASIEDVEGLRLDFQDRYHHFKLLLSANNRALHLMNRLESREQSGEVFGMGFLRSNCTGICATVHQMVRRLERLAPGKYTPLSPRFKTIETEIEHHLSARHHARDARLVILLAEIDRDSSDWVGSKMANLGEISSRLSIAVPRGFVITQAAFDHFLQLNDLQPEINQCMLTAQTEHMEDLLALSASLQQRIVGADIPVDLQNAIHEAMDHMAPELGPDVRWALRSSASGEDTQSNSFAGQYRTILNVSREHIFDAYKEVVASKYSVPAIAYRLHCGFRDEDVGMAVGCLEMVDAECGGVAYSQNPVDPEDISVTIHANWGLPKSVVDGVVDGDLFVISLNDSAPAIRSDVKKKQMKYVPHAREGVRRESLDAAGALAPSVSDSLALDLARQVKALESHYGMPVDIEWAIPRQRPAQVVILQCRPLHVQPALQPELESIHATMAGDCITKGGVTGSSGVATGQVCLVRQAADMLSFPKGAVLVTAQALPRWAPLLARASAVITQHGGVAGHLANVAREFKIPALLGVPEITRQLQPGEMITVDADHRAIYRGKVEGLTVREPQPPRLMQTSPVFQTLKAVNQLIVPLNLKDPDAATFRPDHCLTLHDITRFVHEKAVKEMFDFGRQHRFPERTSKQLYFHGPMQWWILNLDDGFKQDVKSKFIKLEEIASVPMLAFWDGFTAIPWEGPPPLDGAGFLSVMFRATSNPNLNTGARSAYSERNYFMISKHFCSLASRLGFHFSRMEALVSPRDRENYLRFAFKGGAADGDRKARRVSLIGELLSQYDFTTELDGDNLTARMEGYPSAFMLSRLRILGYLTLHTRQLDMIMSRPALVKHYHQKIQNDIDKLLLASRYDEGDRHIPGGSSS